MREEISSYFSDDDQLKATVFETGKKKYEVDFYLNSVKVATESYENKSLDYHEDAAENYVLGVKQL